MILGIVGGMGSAATYDLYEKIINFTHVSKDQEHIHIIIDNNSEIPDRTQYILGKGEDPRVELIRSIIKLEMMGANYIAIPCNTAHYFYEDIIKYTKSNILNMISETAIFVKKAYPECNEFLLLATEGAYISGVYKKVFAEYQLNIEEPNKDDKQTIMGWIYGVKAGKFDIDLHEFEVLINKYLVHKVMPVILGCTELPFLAKKINTKIEYIDPTLILAKRCVEIAKGNE